MYSDRLSNIPIAELYRETQKVGQLTPTLSGGWIIEDVYVSRKSGSKREKRGSKRKKGGAKAFVFAPPLFLSSSSKKEPPLCLFFKKTKKEGAKGKNTEI